MTGFGEAFAENERFRIVAIVRTVNHRFLDLVVRLPEEYRSVETPASEVVRGAIARGRVELRLTIEPVADRPVTVELRQDVLRQLLEQVDTLQAEGLAAGGLGVADVLRLPQVLVLRESPPEWRREDDELVRRTVEEALSQVVAAREHEGANLRAVLLAKVEELEALRDRLEARRLEVAQETLAALSERVTELLADSAIPEERLAQEAALLVERSDVREELDRLEAHADHFRALADGDGPHGRRLEFLVQEIQRELNTVGGKCRDTAMGREVGDGKLVCEQLREQLLNVE